MITVHYLEQSRSQRVLWMLEELGLDYELVSYKRDPRTWLAPPALRKVHPLGKSPVITDNGETIAESGAIIEYLVETYGASATGDMAHLQPAPGTPEHRRCRFWMHYAEGSLMNWLVMKLVFVSIPGQPMPFFAKPIARGIADKMLTTLVDPQLAAHLRYLEGELAGRDWFAGDTFSAADVQMSFPLEAAQARAGLNAQDHPRLVDWLARIHARPAYQRALARGGDYDLLS